MARLESFMVPRDVVFVAELPKTTTAKVSRRLLRDLAVEMTEPTALDTEPAQATSTARWLTCAFPDLNGSGRRRGSHA
jgi:hypothetical protein